MREALLAKGANKQNYYIKAQAFMSQESVRILEKYSKTTSKAMSPNVTMFFALWPVCVVSLPFQEIIQQFKRFEVLKSA